MQFAHVDWFIIALTAYASGMTVLAFALWLSRSAYKEALAKHLRISSEDRKPKPKRREVDSEESRRQTEEQERLAHQRRMQHRSKPERQHVAVEPAERPRPRLIASMGKPVNEGNLVRANFRDKPKGPSGPKGAA